MVFQAFRANGLERAETNIERNFADFDSAPAQFVQYFRGEMQTRGRRGYCTSALRKNRLVPLAIRRLVFTPNVRRQRHMSQAVNSFPNIAARAENQRALAVAAARCDFGLEFSVAEADRFAH